jgi:hypothetical protein
LPRIRPRIRKRLSSGMSLSIEKVEKRYQSFRREIGVASDIDVQMLIFVAFFALATLVVSLTKRRRRRYPMSDRCRLCGRSLEARAGRDGLCSDCYRLGKI